MRRSRGPGAARAAPTLALLVLLALRSAAAQVSGKVNAIPAKLPAVADQHFKFLRSYLHKAYPNPHMDIFSESSNLCESEGADECAAIVTSMLNLLVGADANSRYRELPRSKAAWAAFFKDDLQSCPALGSPAAPNAKFNACRESAVRKLIEAGGGNAILQVDPKKPISLEWVVFFDLPACTLHQTGGDCNGVGCSELLDGIGWTADKCSETK